MQSSGNAGLVVGVSVGELDVGAKLDVGLGVICTGELDVGDGVGKSVTGYSFGLRVSVGSNAGRESIISIGCSSCRSFDAKETSTASSDTILIPRYDSPVSNASRTAAVTSRSYQEAPTRVSTKETSARLLHHHLERCPKQRYLLSSW